MIKFLLWFLVCILSTLGVCYFYYKITDSSFKLSVKMFFTFLIGTLLMTVIKFYNLNLFSAIFYFIYYPVIFHIINPVPIRKLIFYVIIVWFFGILLDLFSMLLVSCFYNIFNFSINLNFLSLLLTIFVFILMIFLAKQKWVVRLCDSIYKVILKIKYYDVILVSLIIFILFMAFLMLFNLKYV